MRKIIICLHTTLDGFVAGPNGEMDWIKLDDEMFDLVGTFTDKADTALYGRVTYEMMDNYWPTAADKHNATKHDIEHSNWYNGVEKIVISKTMQNKQANKTTFIGNNIPDEINKTKQRPGKNIMIFGSPSASHTLMEHNLIDEYWLFVNPVLLGQGIPLFAKIQSRTALELITSKKFGCGVIGLHYRLKQ
ncbi:dihydrofolate reductase [Panacibacter ginsenosidivorans]|uniref:Dihydrofolate reductase n=1 Tax=Panacibacter ginsenosidivorans TaxID=1813871 RepID=A0A5B8V5L8_9BACT|nr:dihydrofolate reductase family protein [Panacibacter ginsenosidivorans]QEC66512.1 dihydrofolate reductase [Panacibacter ginsenosidivorans]